MEIQKTMICPNLGSCPVYLNYIDSFDGSFPDDLKTINVMKRKAEGNYFCVALDWYLDKVKKNAPPLPAGTSLENITMGCLNLELANSLRGKS